MSASHKELRWIRLSMPTVGASLLHASQVKVNGGWKGELGMQFVFQSYPVPSHSEKPKIKETVNNAAKHFER